jgi:hypothetical protein
MCILRKNQCTKVLQQLLNYSNTDCLLAATTALSLNILIRLRVYKIMAVVTDVSVMLLMLIQSLVLVLPSSADPTGTKCAPALGRSETCVCQTQDGIIDMTSLSNGNETARCISMINIK